MFITALPPRQTACIAEQTSSGVPFVLRMTNTLELIRITLELSTFSENLPCGKEIAFQNIAEFELGGPSRHICARGGGGFSVQGST